MEDFVERYAADGRDGTSMQTKPDGWNVVLAGFWNRMIFTPEWVSSRLFEQNAQIETVVALLPVLPIVYRDSQIAIEISAVRIVCRARDLDNEAALRRSGTVAQQILRSLQETPIQGVGVNFAFREPASFGSLLDLFNFPDSARFAEGGWEMGERKIVRQLSHDCVTLNLALTYDKEGVDIECNFHTDADDNETAVAAVAPDRIIELRDKAITMLDELYGLQLEEDHGQA